MIRASICIGDTGATISLATIDKLDLLNSYFDKIYIPQAVWDELVDDESFIEVLRIKEFFHNKLKKIRSVNDLQLIMDRGESEALLLYQELGADILLIDDRKAREIAESLGVNCIGTLALLKQAKTDGKIKNLHNVFIDLIENKRYFSKQILNGILREFNETNI